MASKVTQQREIEAERDARVAALRELGHSGEREKHQRGLFRSAKYYGLVYEKTAARLLGTSVAKLRNLAIPADWIVNPAFTTAPSVPIYDPRTLLETSRFLADHSEFVDSGFDLVRKNRADTDAEVREDYREFRQRAKLWAATKAERRGASPRKGRR